ncbi:MAG: hypothetical protein ACR2GH_17965 [Pseudonocardia sp.]
MIGTGSWTPREAGRPAAVLGALDWIIERAEPALSERTLVLVSRPDPARRAGNRRGRQLANSKYSAYIEVCEWGAHSGTSGMSADAMQFVEDTVTPWQRLIITI